MKRIKLPINLYIFCFIFILFTPIQSAEIYPYQNKNTFIIDNFEDNNLTKQPKWWAFGELDVYIDENNTDELYGLELHGMHIKGRSVSPKLVGGVGTFFGIDARPYNAIKIPIKGYGQHSGILMIELYDDDNNNWAIEIHPKYKSEAYKDDKFTYTMKVDWEGWKVVIIPLKKFKDDNPTFGDNKWNPYQKDKSGGLLQIQLLIFANDSKKTPHMKIDNIKLFNTNKVPKNEPSKKTMDSQFY